MAAIISKGLNKTVEYVPIPIKTVGDVILNAGWGGWASQVMMDYSKAYSEGWGDFTNDHVEAITGKPSRSFHHFFDEVLSHAL